MSARAAVAHPTRLVTPQGALLAHSPIAARADRRAAAIRAF